METEGITQAEPTSTETTEPAAEVVEQETTSTDDTEVATETQEATETHTEEEDHGTTKALKDTKAWATQKAQEAAEARKRVAELEAKIAEATAKPRLSDPALAEKWETVKSAYKDVPELAPLLDVMESVIGGVKGYESEIGEYRNQIELARAHPDVNEIAKSDNFILWLAHQPQETRAMLEQGASVRDKIQALNLYKLEQASRNAEAKLAEAQKAAEAKKKADGLKAVGRGPDGRFAQTDADSFEARLARYYDKTARSA